MTAKPSFLKNYAFSLLLLFSIFVGAILGLIFKEKAVIFKPFGDIFLNLLFTIVVPLVFFSISSAVAAMADLKRLGRILGSMLLVFVATGIIASALMVVGVKLYPPAEGISITLPQTVSAEKYEVSQQIVKALTVPDFVDIFSKKNILALIIFALLLGLATSATGEKGRPFAHFLLSGSEVMLKCISYVMLYAPIGLAAYFAYLVGVFGPQLLGSYWRAMLLYYPLALLYFFIGFSFYAYLAGRWKAVKIFWTNIIPASLTALATGSSMATIPVNLEAAEKNGVPKDISEVVIPIGATIHMDGSCLSAVLKIALLFGLFQMDFSGAGTILTAIGVALLSGIVMSGIPGGGFLGELMIVTLYGFPIEALPIISMIGTLVDPPATMVNSIGDNVASMMVARMLGGKNWMAGK
ncbi:MAG: sodium:proton antiporter [Omnitrophica WOR_2 bacterium RIFCSPHIGHO2_01_FULL_48_9]|nr:MAG: sodium:proton antiporter [Omnitrophica WOR_2 bacterium RIFCSPHIGHO2_01_FULL_48_9]